MTKEEMIKEMLNITLTHELDSILQEQMYWEDLPKAPVGKKRLHYLGQRRIKVQKRLDQLMEIKNGRTD